jgi:AcrR family transcriptional regulator
MEDRGNRENRTKAMDITQAAYLSIVEDGFCDITTQKIAAKAGVSKSMIHYYFKDKNELVSEVARMVIDRLIQIIREVLDRYPTRQEKTDQGITALWDTFTKEQDVWIAMFENAVNGRRIPEIRKSLVSFYRELLSQIADAIFPAEETNDKISAKDAEAIASIFSATIESFIFHYLIDPEATDFEYSLEMLSRVARLLFT